MGSTSRIQAHGTWGDILQAYGAADIPEGETFSEWDKYSVNTVHLSLIHISEPTRLGMISYAVFCLKKKKKRRQNDRNGWRRHNREKESGEKYWLSKET